jgi:hypothetical protein
MVASEWLATDSSTYLATLATSAATFIAIVVSVGAATEAERRGSIQSLQVWQGQLDARETRLETRKADLDADLRRFGIEDYILHYAMWHSSETFSDRRNIAEAPPEEQSTRFGSEVDAIFAESAERAELPKRAGDIEDTSDLGISAESLRFIDECRSVSLAVPGHEAPLARCQRALELHLRDLGSQLSLEAEVKQVVADLAALDSERAAQAGLQAGIRLRPSPKVSLGILGFGCVFIPLALLIVTFRVDYVYDSCIVATIVSFVLGGLGILRWVRQ